jgi:hypothetical protein
MPMTLSRNSQHVNRVMEGVGSEPRTAATLIMDFEPEESVRPWALL